MTITVYDVRFPETIEQRLECVRQFETRVFAAETGYEPSRRIVAPYGRRRYHMEAVPVHKNDLTDSDVETAIHIFEAMQGRAYNFLLKPKNDYAVTRTHGWFGTGDGATTVFQLAKTYIAKNAGGTVQLYRRRPIWRIDTTATAPSIWKNNVLQTVTTHYTINSGTGAITFGTAPANGHVLECAIPGFLEVVRFDSDEQGEEMTGQDQHIVLPEIRLISIDLA
jgi:uncharacterized protein (TIGR02217 family)